MRKIILFLLLIFFCQQIISQDIIPTFNNFSVNEGLPSNSIYSILQDKKGFIWFGTSDGICRYDGEVFRQFKCYPKKNIEGSKINNNLLESPSSKDIPYEIVNNFIRGKIIEDKIGNIWFSNETGIYKWDYLTQNIEKIKLNKVDFQLDGELKLVSIDSSGKLWFINLTQGIISFDTHQNIIKVFPFPFKFNFSNTFHSWFAIEETGAIIFRLFSKDEPCHRFNIKQEKYSAYNSLLPQPHGIFLGNRYNVEDYDTKMVIADKNERPILIINKCKSSLDPFTYINSAVWDNNGLVWLSTNIGGLYSYNLKTHQFKRYLHDKLNRNSLAFNLTNDLFIDYSQNLWIGTDGGGVSKLDIKRPKFNLFPVFESDYPELKDFFIKCFYEDEDKNIWFGTFENGLNIFNPGTHALTHFKHQINQPNSLPGNTVSSILELNSHQILIGTNRGFALFNKGNKTFKKINIINLPELLTASNFLVNKMIQLKNGDILAATSLGIIKMYVKNNMLEGIYFNKNPTLISNTIDIAELPNQMIYAAIQGVGLNMLEPSNKEYKLVQTLFQGYVIKSIRIDIVHQNVLWLSTAFGLVQYDTKTNNYRLWNENNGLANSYVYGSLEDDFHNIWLSTNGGLSYFNPTKNKFENYTYLDGLQANEFNTQAFFKSKTNRFYFGGIKGFNWFQSEIHNREQIIPKVIINDIKVNNETIKPEKDQGYTIKVPHNQNDVNIQFSILDYTRPEANKIQYKLEGWDKDWSYTKNTTVSYNNLSPGYYTLKYRAFNADQICSDYKYIIIDIDAPYWQKLWFLITVFIFCICLIVGMTYWFIKSKQKKKLRLLEHKLSIEAERTRISADMHDEIGSGITQITLLGEQSLDLSKNNQEIRNTMKNIVSTSRNLITTMSEIIWSMNAQNDQLDRLLAYIRERSNDIFEPSKIQHKFSFSDDIPPIQLTNEICRNVYLITKELLNNCIKHSKASMVDISFRMESEQCVFEILDNGIGFSEENFKSYKNGLLIVQNRILAIGGQIEWISSSNGTHVKFNFPIHQKRNYKSKKINLMTSKIFLNHTEVMVNKSKKENPN